MAKQITATSTPELYVPTGRDAAFMPDGFKPNLNVYFVKQSFVTEYTSSNSKGPSRFAGEPTVSGTFPSERYALMSAANTFSLEEIKAGLSEMRIRRVLASTVEAIMTEGQLSWWTSLEGEAADAFLENVAKNTVIPDTDAKLDAEGNYPPRLYRGFPQYGRNEVVDPLDGPTSDVDTRDEDVNKLLAAGVEPTTRNIGAPVTA